MIPIISPPKTFSMVPFILMCHWIVSSPPHRNWRKNNILFSLFSHEPVTTSHVWVSEEMTDDATQGNLPLSFLSKYFFFRQKRGEQRASTQQQLQINSFIINSHLSSIFLTHPLLYLECERLCDDFFPLYVKRFCQQNNKLLFLANALNTKILGSFERIH